MKRLLLCGCFSLMLSAPTLAGFSLENEPLLAGAEVPDSTLDTVRGGFDLEGTFFRIGLSMETLFNDVPFFNSHIAGFTITNGKLAIETPKTPDIPSIPKIQLPDIATPATPVTPGVVVTNNPSSSEAQVTVASATSETSSAPSRSVAPPITVSENGNVKLVQAGEGNVAPTNLSAINDAIVHVIQNSLNDQKIGVKTTVDIDAQISTLMRKREISQKIDSAIRLSHFN